MADQACHLGGSLASESYLRGDKIIEVAKLTGANAIHPGYGFLSENAEFAEKVSQAGIIFIGPTPESIRILGDKVNYSMTTISMTDHSTHRAFDGIRSAQSDI
jgi:acetyl/propionyl-CoA carboxylase alpha subunit